MLNIIIIWSLISIPSGLLVAKFMSISKSDDHQSVPEKTLVSEQRVTSSDL